MTMDETIQRSIDRNFDRILHDGRGAAYVGREDWLRERLALMAKNELGKGSSPAGAAAFLDTVDPVAPGIMRMYL